MRTTSARRRQRHGGGSKYRGSLGSAPAPRERHDYAGDGPAEICDRCGARVRVGRAHRAGGGMPKPWNKCGVELEVSDSLPALLPTEIVDRQLVTRKQIASRFQVSVATLLPNVLPAPVGVEASRTGGLLYDAREVESLVRRRKPHWVVRAARAS